MKQPIYATLADLTAHLPPERKASSRATSSRSRLPSTRRTSSRPPRLRDRRRRVAKAVAGALPSPGEGYGLEELWGLMADGSPLGDELRASAEAALGRFSRGPTARRTAARASSVASASSRRARRCRSASASRGGSSPRSRRSRRARAARPRRSSSALESPLAGSRQPPRRAVRRPRAVQRVAPPRASPRAPPPRARRRAVGAEAAEWLRRPPAPRRAAGAPRLPHVLPGERAALAHERPRRRAVGHLRRQPVLRVAGAAAAFRWLERIRVHSTAALDAAATRRCAPTSAPPPSSY